MTIAHRGWGTKPAPHSKGGGKATYGGPLPHAVAAPVLVPRPRRPGERMVPISRAACHHCGGSIRLEGTVEVETDRDRALTRPLRVSLDAHLACLACGPVAWIGAPYRRQTLPPDDDGEGTRGRHRAGCTCPNHAWARDLVAPRAAADGEGR